MERYLSESQSVSKKAYSKKKAAVSAALYPQGPGLKEKPGSSDKLLPVIKKPKKVAATMVLSCKKCKGRCHHNSF
ncbi:MAG: hypothetical protein WC238_03410 [Parcubacteria group bacterium]|jgi:hypothetical protein